MHNEELTLLLNTEELSIRLSVGMIPLKHAVVVVKLFYALDSSVTMGQSLQFQVFRARKRHSPSFINVDKQFALFALKQKTPSTTSKTCVPASSRSVLIYSAPSASAKVTGLGMKSKLCSWFCNPSAAK